MTPEDIEKRFKYHPPAGELRVEAHANTRIACWGLAQLLNESLPEGREN